MKHKPRPNRLISEKSPYLLQHAYNPVDWYPWGNEALQRSKSESKPILLSIGYSTCHWCHVMEEESFMDPAIAQLMNDNFICIKVDREERPDLDKIYITAVSALTGSAGWPLNVFLTPEQKPFFGGTYFPPAQKPGILAWPDLLSVISAAWQHPDKRQQLLSSGDELTKNIASYFSWSTTDDPINFNLIHKAFDNFTLNYDKRAGGFSPAPKFPSPSIQNFLMVYYHFCENKENKAQQRDQALIMSNFTLRAMANGGIYDHVGGGFHRYSTDAKWHVPHFEKMLYDNAQLIDNYVDAYQITHDSFFADVAMETADYVLADMVHSEGGFYSAEDADSLPLSSEAHEGEGAVQKVEGAFYVWEQHEIDTVLGSRVGKIFAFRYGIKPGGNVEFDPHGDFKGKNILFVAHSLDETANAFGIAKNEVEQIITASKLKLLNIRNQRPKPHLDDKILTSWNGLMVTALSRAYQVFGKEEYLQAAQKAANFIQKYLYDPKNRLLYRRWRQGERKISGVASDYAFLIQGLIDLYEADFDPSWLEWAVVLADRQIDLFYDATHGGFFMTSKDHDKHLIMRVKEDLDSALPSDNSV
ncbi:MAG: thioredoxin domain-containing protein, partial [Desulfobacterales bacterium]